MEFQLKPNLLLGAATAATQIEGGDQNNNWYGWYRQGHIKGDADPSIATDHYNRWQDDLKLMSAMGIQCYRMGIEWSRVEPEDGVFDETAIAHYRDEIQALLDRGIRPLLPAAALVLFLPTVPLYYNFTAWVYGPVYGVVVLLGCCLGRVFYGRR